MRFREVGLSRAVRASATAFLFIAALPFALSAQSTVAAPPAAAAGEPKDLPAARQIIDRHIEATGGRKAVLGRSSVHIVATMNVPAQGMTATVEEFKAKPNKSFARISLPGLGEVMEGFDGTNGWLITPMTGPMLMQGRQLEQKKFDADFNAELYEDGRYTSMKTVEKTTFDGRPCYKVSLTKADGGEEIEFFDANTGLKAGRIMSRETPMGAMSITATIGDYKKFGDALVPTTVKQSTMGVEQLVTITSVEYDKVDPAVFELPAAIKALIK